MKLTDEYEAAVNLGLISRRQAEKEQIQYNLQTIDPDDLLQRKAFCAGYLWMNFKNGWDCSEDDLAQAGSAWTEYCQHLETKKDPRSEDRGLVG